MASEAPTLDARTKLLGKIQSAAAAGDVAALKSELGQLDNTAPLGLAGGSSDDGQDLIQSVFEESAKSGHVEITAFLLEQRNCVPTRWAIRNAMSSKHWDVVELLLRSGWDINQSMGGNTLPIMFPYLHSYEHVQWLLLHGADPNIRSAGKNNHLASQAGRFSPPPVLRLLHTHGANFRQSNALHEAAYIGQAANPRRWIESMTYLLDEADVSINMRQWEWDKDFFEANSSMMELGTALHAAVRGGKVAHLEFLLERGADPGVEDTKGRTPCELARDMGFKEGLALLEPLSQPQLPRAR